MDPFILKTLSNSAGAQGMQPTTLKQFQYDEKSTSLDQRISSHRQYSNFDLHEWIKEKFRVQPGQRILDLGCGNGNFTELFWQAVGPEGHILGCDKNETLIHQALDRHSGITSKNVRFLTHDFDSPLPGDEQFDWIFAIYSIYYSEDSSALLEMLLERLRVDGVLVIIGPGPENILGLTEFSTRLTGEKPRLTHLERMKRISDEFQPVLKKELGDSRIEYLEVDSMLEFPDAESFANYYWATLNWRENVENFDEQTIRDLKEKTILWANQNPQIRTVQKQMSCLIGNK